MDTIESTTSSPPLRPPFEMAAGELYAGITRDVETGDAHHVVLLPDRFIGKQNVEQATDLKASIRWATSVGGEIPAAPEWELLFANLRGQFDPERCYWSTTNEIDRAGWPFVLVYCARYVGLKTSCNPESNAFARAVRKVAVTAA